MYWLIGFRCCIFSYGLLIDSNSLLLEILEYKCATQQKLNRNPFAGYQKKASNKQTPSLNDLIPTTLQKNPNLVTSRTELTPCLIAALKEWINRMAGNKTNKPGNFLAGS
jgi:hypothetical protein